MDLKKIKTLLIALIVITILLLIAISIMKKIEKKRIEVEPEEPTSPYEEYIPEKVANVLTDFTVYNRLKTVLSTFMLYKNAGNNSAVEEITGDLNAFQNVAKEDSPIMLDVVYRTGDTMNNINFVKFRYYKSQASYYAVVILDRENEAFKIIESNSTEYENAKNGKIDEKYNQKITIEAKKYNKLKSASYLAEQDIITEYFKDYIQKALYYPQEAYEKLNKEYREKRFGSIEKFGIYLQEKREELESLDIYSIKLQKDFATTEEYANYMKNRTTKKLAKYQTKIYDNHTEYTCIDDYGNYYIFRITGAMQYEIMLDEYTIDFSDFIAKYNSATNQEKAVLNVNKFLRAVQDKNYTYAYSKLSEDYKQNYFKTEELFKAYVQANWLKYEDITNVDVEEENGVYKCKVNLKNGQTKQFIMKLNAGTDFVMSFTI